MRRHPMFHAVLASALLIGLPLSGALAQTGSGGTGYGSQGTTGTTHTPTTTNQTTPPTPPATGSGTDVNGSYGQPGVTGSGVTGTGTMHVGDPYTGPPITFPGTPEIVPVQGRSNVSYIKGSDYDMYRSGTNWYYRYDGRWYRGTNYSGPFTYVTTSSVPRTVRTVPAKYRHHWTSASTTTSTTVTGTRSASHRKARVKSRHTARTTGYSRTHRTTSTSMGSAGSSYDDSHSSGMDNGGGSSMGSMGNGGTGTTGTVAVGQPYSGPAITFTTTPVIAVIPGTQVSYIRDSSYDMYRVGTDWYMNYNGTWYRGTSYNGPFLSIETTSVPHSVMVVPTQYRHNWR